jgi:hypothetical protein
MAAYEICHMEELGLPKKQYITTSGEKSIDAAQQVGDLSDRIVWSERGSC